MVYFTTILHFVFFTIFSLTYLTLLVRFRTLPYTVLFVTCLLQIIIDAIIFSVNDNLTSSIIALANVGIVFLVIGVESVLARLLHDWSSSMKYVSPTSSLTPISGHRFLVWSVRALHIALAVIGLLAMIGLGLMANVDPFTQATGFRFWQATIWILVIFSLYLLALIVIHALYRIRRVPENIIIHRKAVVSVSVVRMISQDSF